MLQEIFKYIEDNKEIYLKDLFGLLRKRSISAINEGMEDCAEYLAEEMRKIGISTTIFPTKRHPIVFGEVGPDNAPTVLIYGHYDVQHPEPLELWDSDPFEPEVRNGKIFARGSSDNKGQLFAHIKGVQAYKEVAGNIPIKMKFLFEGEEEISSPNLEPFVENNKDLLKCDLFILSDSHVHESGNPIIVLGLKGMLYVELILKGANRDIHSMQATSIPSPVWRMVHLLSTLKGEDGYVRIPGFYDDVCKTMDEELTAVEQIPYDEKEIMSNLQINKLLDNRHNNHFYKNIIFEPTCNISGLTAGYQGEGEKTVLPSRASAKIDMRLVPNQSPQKILALLRKYLNENGYSDVEIVEHGFLYPSRTEITHPYVKVLEKSIMNVYGVKPYIYPRIGGAGPNYVFEKHLKVPCFVIPFAESDQKNHAPNESLVLDGYYKGIKTSVSIMNEVAKHLNESGDNVENK